MSQHYNFEIFELTMFSVDKTEKNNHWYLPVQLTQCLHNLYRNNLPTCGEYPGMLFLQ